MGPRRILLPLAGPLDRLALEAALRTACDGSAVLVPAVLLVVPLRFREDECLATELGRAFDALDEAVRIAGEGDLRVEPRISTGRGLRHALRRLWEDEPFDRIVAWAATGDAGGFTVADLAWLLARAPVETVVVSRPPH